jgi:hypothetical protein
MAWHELTAALSDRLAAAGTVNPEGVRFLLSAHASHEELFLFTRLTEELLGDGGTKAISVSWRHHVKRQPTDAKFTVPAVDAPNVNGARLFGLVPGAPGSGVREADASPLRKRSSRRVTALYA